MICMIFIPQISLKNCNWFSSPIGFGKLTTTCIPCFESDKKSRYSTCICAKCFFPSFFRRIFDPCTRARYALHSGWFGSIFISPSVSARSMLVDLSTAWRASGELSGQNWTSKLATLIRARDLKNGWHTFDLVSNGGGGTSGNHVTSTTGPVTWG